MFGAREQKKSGGLLGDFRIGMVVAVLLQLCSGVASAGFGLAINLSQPEQSEGRWSIVPDNSVRATVTDPPEQTTSVILCEGRVASVYNLQQAAVWPFWLQYTPLPGEAHGSSRSVGRRVCSVPVHFQRNNEASSGGYTVKMTAELEEVVTALDPVRTLTSEHGGGVAFYLMLITPPDHLVSRLAAHSEGEECQQYPSDNRAVRSDLLHPCYTLRLTESLHGDDTDQPWRCSLISVFGWPAYLDAATGRSTQRSGADVAEGLLEPERRSDLSGPAPQRKAPTRKVVNVCIERGPYAFMDTGYFHTMFGGPITNWVEQQPGGRVMMGCGMDRATNDGALCHLKERTAGQPWRWPVDDVLMIVGAVTPGTQGHFIAGPPDGEHLRIASYDGLERVFTPYKYVVLCDVRRQEQNEPCGQCKSCRGGVCEAVYRVPPIPGIPCILSTSLRRVREELAPFWPENPLTEAVGALTIETTPGRVPQVGGQRDERLWAGEALAPDECVVIVACYQPCKQRRGSDSLTGTRWLRLRLTTQGLRPVYDGGEHTDYIAQTEVVDKELLLTARAALQARKLQKVDEDASVIRFLEPSRPGYNLCDPPREMSGTHRP